MKSDQKEDLERSRSGRKVGIGVVEEERDGFSPLPPELALERLEEGVLVDGDLLGSWSRRELTRKLPIDAMIRKRHQQQTKERMRIQQGR